MTWQKLVASGLTPAPRGGLAVSAVGRTLLLFGGADRTPRAYDDLWQLEIGSSCQALWTRTSAALPSSVACTARSGAALVAVGDKVYLFGGQEPNTGLCFNDVLELDTSTWTWEQLQVEGTRPPARHSCVAVSFKDQCMLIYGGAGHQGALSDVWVFNCLDKTWTNPRISGKPPAAREMTTGVLLSPDQLLIHGGRSSDGKVLDDVVVLNMGPDWTWGSSSSTGLRRCAHTLAALPPARQQQQLGGTASAADAQSPQQQQQTSVFVFGGFSGETVEGSLWTLQQQDQQQASISSNGSSCSWLAKQLHEGTNLEAVLAAKSSCKGNSSSSSSQECCPAPRFAHAAACLPDPMNLNKQVLVVVQGVNPIEDLMDCYIWRQ